MSKTKIKIDKLNLNLKGVSKKNSKILADGLGNQILNQIIKNRNVLKNRPANNINSIDAGNIKIGKSENIPGLRKSIASRISSNLIAKTRKT